VSVPKVVLLPIRTPEDPITGEGDHDDDPGSKSSEFDVLEGEVSRLERISERNPQKVSGGKHVTKPVGCDVHNCEDGRLFHVSALPAYIKAGFKGTYLVVNCIRDIPQMEPKDEHHRIRQRATASNVLLASHTDVDEGPKDQARPELIE